MAWPMIYRVRHRGGDQNDPVLREYLWDDLPTNVKGRKRHVISSMHKNSSDDDMVCFYSGVQTYLSAGEFKYSPWEVTREHLVAVVNAGSGCGGSNIVFAGALLNMKLGHSPLPVKLHIRQQLSSCVYDRNRPTYETFRNVIGHVIQIEDAMRVGGKYPWQPHTYDPNDPHYAMVQDFHSDMKKAEEDFLALPPEGRREWIRDFRWRW
jgi:hypothetical protein